MEIDVKKYIESKIPELNGHIFPVFTTDLGAPSLVYDFKSLTRGHVNQSQLQLKIIWGDYDKCKDLEEKLNGCLAFEEDEPFAIYGNTRFYSVLSGGGVLFNPAIQMYENTLIYILKWRNING